MLKKKTVIAVSELQIDWGDSGTEVRETIDEVFARTSTLERADNASCGCFKITGSKQELAKELKLFAAVLDRVAEDFEASSTNTGENQ